MTYRCKFMGLNAIQNGLISFKNVKVPKENIILGEGQGLKLALMTLNTGRLTLPATVTGASKWCLSVARRWGNERKQWGCSIGEHEAIASKISSMAASVFAMDAVTWLVSHMADNKKYDIRLEAAIAKLFCTETCWNIVDDTMQIRGGRGYETGPSLKGRGEPAFPVERALRDSRVNTILEGSSEIMHLFIAREALDFHLSKIKPILDPKVPIGAKVSAAFSMGISYFIWYLKLWIPSFGGCNLPSPLDEHMKFIRRTVKRLAKSIFYKMMIHQQRLANKQNILNRFVDIGGELFAMASVVSYTESLIRKGGDRKNLLELSDLFCRQARNRIAGKFNEVSHNNDKISNAIAKRILRGSYEWLENDIIKL